MMQETMDQNLRSSALLLLAHRPPCSQRPSWQLDLITHTSTRLLRRRRITMRTMQQHHLMCAMRFRSSTHWSSVDVLDQEFQGNPSHFWSVETCCVPTSAQTGTVDAHSGMRDAAITIANSAIPTAVHAESQTVTMASRRITTASFVYRRSNRTRLANSLWHTTS